MTEFEMYLEIVSSKINEFSLTNFNFMIHPSYVFKVNQFVPNNIISPFSLPTPPIVQLYNYILTKLPEADMKWSI